MRNPVKIASLGVALTVICACGGGDTDIFHNNLPGVTAAYPCKGVAGDQVTIIGHDLLGVGGGLTVDFGGVNATIVSSSNSKIVVTVPAGAGTKVHISNAIGDASSPGTFTNGATTTVPEIEPNDDINGTNATPVGLNFKASGTLNGAGDKDHFTFGCLDQGVIFKIKVTPRVVSQIFVNGFGHPVDANGFATFFPPVNGTALIGLTGGNGAYTLEMSLQ